MRSKRPTFFIFGGLPGTGKTTLARQLATTLKAAYFRIDTVEQGLRDLCHTQVTAEGYRLTYRLVADNLALGIDCIADSCNPIDITREEWRAIGEEASADVVEIEIICSDRAEHRRRVETRHAQSKAAYWPTWAAVEAREYHPWTRDHLVIDTAESDIAEAFKQLQNALAQRKLPVLA